MQNRVKTINVIISKSKQTLINFYLVRMPLQKNNSPFISEIEQFLNIIFHWFKFRENCEEIG